MWYKIGFDDYSQNHAYVQQIYKLTNHANSQSHNLKSVTLTFKPVFNYCIISVNNSWQQDALCQWQTLKKSVPETGTRKPVTVSGMYDMQSCIDFFWYQILVSDRTCSIWCQFLVQVSWASVTGISCHHTHTRTHRYISFMAISHVSMCLASCPLIWMVTGAKKFGSPDAFPDTVYQCSY